MQDLAVNDARNQLLTITRDEICTVWDLTSGKCIQTIDPFYIPSAVSSAPKREAAADGDVAQDKSAAEKKCLISTLFLNEHDSCVVLGTKAAWALVLGSG